MATVAEKKRKVMVAKPHARPFSLGPYPSFRQLLSAWTEGRENYNPKGLSEKICKQRFTRKDEFLHIGSSTMRLFSRLVGVGLSIQQSVIMISARATIPKTNKPRNRATAQI